MDKTKIVSEVKEYAVRESTMAKLKKAGLPLPSKPEEKAEGVDIFTEWESMKNQWGGIANIPFHELGRFLDEWTSMVAYARWVEAVADIDQATSREIRDTIKKQLYTLQEGSRELRDASVHTEELYREWEQKYVESLTMLLGVRGLREGYEYRTNAISREITRRGGDLTDARRNDNRGGM